MTFRQAGGDQSLAPEGIWLAPRKTPDLQRFSPLSFLKARLLSLHLSPSIQRVFNFRPVQRVIE